MKPNVTAPSKMLWVKYIEKSPTLHTNPQAVTIFLEPNNLTNPPQNSAEKEHMHSYT